MPLPVGLASVQSAHVGIPKSPAKIESSSTTTQTGSTSKTSITSLSGLKEGKAKMPINKFSTREEREAEQDRLHAQVNAQVEGLLPRPSPHAVLRHEPLNDPSEFPPATRIRDLHTQLAQLRAPFGEAMRASSEAAARRDEAQAALDRLDPMSTPERYEAASARLRSLQLHARTLGTRAMLIKNQIDFAESELKIARQAYWSVISEINSIPLLDDKPLDEHETVESRAKLHGRLAELSYLLKTMLESDTSTARGAGLSSALPTHLPHAPHPPNAPNAPHAEQAVQGW